MRLLSDFNGLAALPSMSAKAASSKQISPEQLEELLREEGIILVDDRQLVWNTTSNKYPKNWPRTQKCLNISFIVTFEALASAMSTAGTAAANQAQAEFSIGQTLSYFAFTTLSIVAEALAGLIFPPLSESFGRKPQYVIGAAFSALGFGITTLRSLPAVFIGRFIAGIAGGIPPSISPGALEDVLETPTSKTWAIFAWATCSNIGLVVGPIISSQLVSRFGWRTTFYAGTVTAVAILIMSLVYEESRPNRLLQRKLHLVRKRTGRNDISIENPDDVVSWHEFVQQTLTRPARLFVTEPIVFMCSILNGIAFALIYGLTESLTIVFSDYGFSENEANLAFIPVLVGVLLSVIFRFYDTHSVRKREAKGLQITPESRLGSFAISAPLLAVGLWWFAWTIPPMVKVPFIVPMLSLVTAGLAANDFDTVLADYLVASYGMYAASAFAALAWVRALISAAFTLFTSIMYQKLGNNYATTILAAVSTVFCLAPFVLLAYGRKLRDKSPFAKYSAEASKANLMSSESFASETSEVSQAGGSRVAASVGVSVPPKA